MSCVPLSGLSGERTETPRIFPDDVALCASKGLEIELFLLVNPREALQRLRSDLSEVILGLSLNNLA